MAPFAVVSTTAGFRAEYDPSGNMVLRVENGVVYTQTFDAENRLVAVTTPTGTVQFRYDGDGNRVLRIGPEGTTVYIGGYYEKRGAVVTKYYDAAGQRIAVRVGGVVYWLQGDHLGSATLTTGAGGNRVGEARYTPYGEMRRDYPVGLIPTDRRYTGQRWDDALGLYDYRARYYHPALGRFISADPVVPEVGNPQGLNRYAYVTNNPLRYTDPSGHWLETAWDILNIGWDIYEVYRDPRNAWNWVALAADVRAVILPVVPGGVGLVRERAGQPGALPAEGMEAQPAL